MKKNRFTKLTKDNLGEFLDAVNVDFKEKWLLDFLLGCEASLKSPKDGSNMYLYCEKVLSSSFYKKKYYLQVLFDINTLKPALPIFSSLRNSFIDLTDSFTLEDFLKEEIYYINLVDKFLSEVEKTSKMSTRSTLLRYFEEE